MAFFFCHQYTKQPQAFEFTSVFAVVNCLSIKIPDKKKRFSRKEREKKINHLNIFFLLCSLKIVKFYFYDDDNLPHSLMCFF